MLHVTSWVDVPLATDARDRSAKAFCGGGGGMIKFILS